MSAIIEVKIPNQIEQVPFAIVNPESLADYLLSNNIFPLKPPVIRSFPPLIDPFPGIPHRGLSHR